MLEANMSIPETIVDNIKTLPKSTQLELLDFVEYLKQKTEKEEDIAWSNLSIASAMRGMETEDSPYSQSDLKETC
jgi:hypothetical protein